MDALLSQLKGQGSPFSSPLSKPNSVEKLLDIIHLLSQATVLVTHQLQERNTPVNAKPHRETHLPTPPLTPKSSSVSPTKKTPPPKSSAPVLSWVPRTPEYYRLPSPNQATPTPTSVLAPAKPIPHTPHTKKDRKPKCKRITPSTQPNPSLIPSTTTLATPSRPVQTDQREPSAQPPSTIPSRPVQTDERKPPAQTHTLSPETEARLAKKRLAKKEQRMRAAAAAKEAQRELAASLPPKPSPTPTPKPPSSTYEDVTAPIAPANAIVNFPHTYPDCPRLPECPAHKVEFAVSCQAYVDRKRGATLPPSMDHHPLNPMQGQGLSFGPNETPHGGLFPRQIAHPRLVRQLTPMHTLPTVGTHPPTMISKYPNPRKKDRSYRSTW